MGRNAKTKARRREKRKLILSTPPCSYTKCPNGRPPGTHVARTATGDFFTACDDCVEPMAHALRLEGVDVQIATVEALAMIKPKKNAGSPPTVETPADPSGS